GEKDWPRVGRVRMATTTTGSCIRRKSQRRDHLHPYRKENKPGPRIMLIKEGVEAYEIGTGTAGASPVCAGTPARASHLREGRMRRSDVRDRHDAASCAHQD